MAPPSLASPALACMQDIQQQCFRLGIPLRTRHREVAPNQYEFAPLYGTVTTQIDQNLMVMQIIEETAASFGLAALLQEKPFQVCVHMLHICFCMYYECVVCVVCIRHLVCVCHLTRAFTLQSGKPKVLL